MKANSGGGFLPRSFLPELSEASLLLLEAEDVLHGPLNSLVFLAQAQVA